MSLSTTELSMIKSEIDVPPEDSSNQTILSNSQIKILSNKDVDKLEAEFKYAEKMEKHVYKRHGLNLLICSGVVYVLLVIFDTVIINSGYQTSPFMEGLLEMIKFIISTLIGFVSFYNIKDKQ